MMKIPSMRRIKNIYFIGIGGSGMSGIAEVLLNLGYRVSGSDKNASSITDRLVTLGAKIFTSHQSGNVDGVDLVVTSSAISSDNPELVAALQRHLPIIPRALMLAELMRFHYGIAVAGTHGKTTTTSLLATILSVADLDPTFVVGGILNSANSSARLGRGQYFVVEADESDASFLHFNPMASIVTNIDADHMTTYGNDITKLKEAFINFLHRLPFYGLAVVCIDDPVVREILPQISRPVITYGFSEDADVRVYNFKQRGFGSGFQLDLKCTGEKLSIHLNLPGRHNVLNAVAASIVAYECCHVETKDIVGALEKFSGVGRRMERYGEISFPKGKVVLVDDYGHHPKEIEVTVEALRSAYPGKRLVLAFQPHRYTRTRDLFEDFVKVLSSVDSLFLMEIYAASEPPLDGVHSQALLDKIKLLGDTRAIFVENNDELISKLPSILEDGDVLLVQGAGNIGTVASRLQKTFG